MKALLCVLSCVVLVCMADAVPARVVHVPGEQPDIASGLAAAASGDTVVVACNVYYEHDLVMKSGVHLCAEEGAPYVMIDAFSERAMTATGVSSQTSIEGITFSRGRGTDTGGALLLADAPVQVIRCMFSVNSSTRGGAVHLSSSDACFVECCFLQNEANALGGGSDWAGGAVYCSDSSPEFRECVFSDNHGNMAGVTGVAACVAGPDASASFTDCTFEGNIGVGASQGGAVGIIDGGAATFERCDFSMNVAGIAGGGIFANNGSFDVNCSTFWCNQSGAGGAIFTGSGGSGSSLSSSTLVANQASEGGGVYVSDNAGALTIEHSAIAAGGNGEGVRCTGSVIVSCTDIFGNAGGDWIGCIAAELGVDGNFSADPLFCDVPTGDLTLCGDSPCLPGNHPHAEVCSLIGARPEGCGPCGPSSVEETSWGMIKVRMR